MDTTTRALAESGTVVIFPKPTFTRDPLNQSMKTRTGITRLALTDPDIVVVPVARWGNEGLIDPWTDKVS